MSYYTSYDLEIKPVKDEEVSLIRQTLGNEGLFGYVFEDDPYLYKNELSFCTFDEQKWYDHDKVMTEISEKYPDKVFKLNCRGEDGELWQNYYQAGKEEVCDGRIVYDEPKEIKWPE